MINWRDPKKELPTIGQEVWTLVLDEPYLPIGRVKIHYKEDLELIKKEAAGWVPLKEINLPDFGDKDEAEEES